MDDNLRAALTLIGKVLAEIEQANRASAMVGTPADTVAEVRHALGMRRFNSAEGYTLALIAHIERLPGPVAERLQVAESSTQEYNASAAPRDALLTGADESDLRSLVLTAETLAAHYRHGLHHIATHDSSHIADGASAYYAVKQIAQTTLRSEPSRRAHIERYRQALEHILATTGELKTQYAAGKALSDSE